MIPVLTRTTEDLFETMVFHPVVPGHPGTIHRVVCPFRFDNEDIFVELVLTRAGQPRPGEMSQEASRCSR
ncbi:MAG TPA: hypothetical protein VNE16_16745 [Vicinamibacterales bacterium]|nr:hypothetical protein [Vicinamibacterales bacterium]